MASQEVDGPAGRPPAAPLRWVGLGAATAGALCVVDVAGRAFEGSYANIAATLALAPALTAVGGTRRHTAWVGVLALACTVALVLADGLPLAASVVRCTVVGVAAVVAAVVAGRRTAQVAQLKDRRETARALQEAMLSDLPVLGSLDLTARYLPARTGDQVGGDWYDAVVGADGVTTLVIGDVTGHDVHAAARMGQVRAMLRAYAVEGGQGPAALLARLDAAVDLLRLDVLATVAVVRFGPGQDLRWVNAGHPPPALLRADGRVELLADDLQDVLVGVLGDPVRTERTVPFGVGDTLLLYTDGLVERRGEDLRDGNRRLLTALAAHRSAAPAGLLDGVLRDVLGPDHLDDVAVLAARLLR
ncbi:SpoIIE family protein phosphatase [Kineococcus aurantiacus]|uniref:PPM-type phosphatase domain-containing protein n=1 Tax=Kineococcus aurantiacus TaxID=37633 RepID=A0A7Y9J2A7_9ACTN|nr:hypothetical protein [Kineococcus aurantiacus]